MIDPAPSDEQVGLAAAVRGVVERHRPVGDDATPELWCALGDVGILALCADGWGGTPADLVAGMEALGESLCPGPVVATAAASRILDGERLVALAGGRLRPTLTDGSVVPWAASCNLVIELAPDGAWEVAVREIVPSITLSGEPWARATTTRLARLGDVGDGAVFATVAACAYLVGAASRALTMAANHAREREQFGRSIGSFQAVAQPLARCHAEVSAARELLRFAALQLATGPSPLLDGGLVRAEIVAATVRAVERSHQAMGAVGFAVETGLAVASTRVRQWAQLPIVSSSLFRQPDDIRPRRGRREGYDITDEG